MLILPPLFKDSPASPFLTAYYPDCVGMSPSGSSSNMSLGELRADHCRAAQPQSKSEFRRNAIFKHLLFTMLFFFLHIITVLCPHWRSWSLLCPSVPGLCPYFQPFYQPNECGKALCVRPDMMELDELYEFPEFSRDPTMYLALRNLILASWHKNCKVQQSQKWPLGSFKISNKGEKDHSESPMFFLIKFYFSVEKYFKFRGVMGFVFVQIIKLNQFNMFKLGNI